MHALVNTVYKHLFESLLSILSGINSEVGKSMVGIERQKMLVH